MLWEKNVCVRAARSSGCYYNEVMFLNINSLQLRKPSKMLCQARNNWQEVHHQ